MLSRLLGFQAVLLGASLLPTALNDTPSRPRPQNKPIELRHVPSPPSPPLKVKVTDLRVTVRGEALGSRQTPLARLEEALAGVWGLVFVGASPEPESRRQTIYARYFDAKGRFCFSLQFWGGSRRALRAEAGDDRSAFLSMTASLAPAVEPRSAELYRLTTTGGGHQRTAGSQPVVESEPTLESSSEIEPWQRLWLTKRELQSATAPILDIALAGVNLDDNGHPVKIRLEGAVSEAAAGWMRHFLAHQRFQPAKRGNIPEPSYSLVLVRAVVSLKDIRASYFLPRDSAWVKRYVESLSGERVPSVNLVLLIPSTYNRDWKYPRPGYFGYNGVGSYWSILAMTRDSSIRLPR